MDAKNALEVVEALRSTVPSEELIDFDNGLERYTGAMKATGDIVASNTIFREAAISALEEADRVGFQRNPTTRRYRSEVFADAAIAAIAAAARESEQ